MSHYATVDPVTQKLTGWYDLDFADYPLLDMTTAVAVPDDIWADRVGKTYVFDGANIVAWFPPPPSHADRIASALSALAAVRYAHEIAGLLYTPSSGSAYTIPTDRDSQAKLNAAFVMASNGFWIDGTPWKLADGSFAPMDKATIQDVAVKVAGHVAACFAHEAILAGEISVSTDPETIDTSTGWPA